MASDKPPKSEQPQHKQPKQRNTSITATEVIRNLLAVVGAAVMTVVVSGVGVGIMMAKGYLPADLFKSEESKDAECATKASEEKFYATFISRIVSDIRGRCLADIDKCKCVQDDASGSASIGLDAEGEDYGEACVYENGSTDTRVALHDEVIVSAKDNQDGSQRALVYSSHFDNAGAKRNESGKFF